MRCAAIIDNFIIVYDVHHIIFHDTFLFWFSECSYIVIMTNVRMVFFIYFFFRLYVENITAVKSNKICTVCYVLIVGNINIFRNSKYCNWCTLDRDQWVF